MIKPILQLK